MSVSKKPDARSMFTSIQKDREVKKEAETKVVVQKEEVIAPVAAPIQEPEEIKAEPVVQEKAPATKKKAEKSKAVTFYLSPETTRMIKEASKAYGGNGSLYLRSLVGRDYAENKEKYASLPDIIY